MEEGRQLESSVKIIAEIANAHQGKPELALKLAKAAKEAGADAVKFQIYFADEFLTGDHPKYHHFKEQSFTNKSWDFLLQEAKKLNTEVYADIFGLQALETALKNDIAGFKVHSSDLSNTKLLDKLSYQAKKIFLATGGSTILEIRYAIDRINQFNKPSEIVLLHGFQAYPTKVEDSVLSRLQKLKELFGDAVTIGYSDHTDAEDTFATILPIMAIPYGISYIEKHIILDRSKKGIDYYSAFEPKEFRKFINDIERAEKALSGNPFKFPASEKHYRNTVKKSWVSTKKLRAEDIIKESDIIMKGTPVFFNSPSYEEIVGNKISHPLEEDKSIVNLDLHHKVLAVIVARSSSSRLPNKALLDINGKPAITHLFERIKIAKEKGYVDSVAFCTTVDSADDKLVNIAKDYPFRIYRGSVENVLSRMILAIDDNNDHDIVLRITGDDLLVDIDYLKKAINYHIQTNAHYTDVKKLPSGTEVEVFDASILKLIYELSEDSSGSEYLTNYIRHNEDQFNTASMPVEKRHEKNFRLTLDTKEDYEVIKRLLLYMKTIGKEYIYGLDDIVDFLEKNPEIPEINKDFNSQPTHIKVNTEMEWNRITKKPLVTVYITNHNYSKFIKQSIDSVLNQKFRDFELLIIDDGSTDNSRDIIEKFRNHPKVKIIYQQNKGLNVTNNIALKIARGRYLMRLDADDYLDENALLIMSNKLERDFNLGLVFPDYYLVDENGKTVCQEKRHNFEEVTLKDQPAHGACTMIRKEALISVGGYCEDFTCQDGYELWIKMIKKFKVSNINLPLFYYRQHDRNLTKNQEIILTTRSEIIKKNINQKEIKAKNHICILPIRGQEEGCPLSIRKFAKTTPLEIAIDGILMTENITKAILSTPDEKIIEYARNKYKDRIVTDKRPLELSGLNMKLEETANYLIKKYKDYFNEAGTITLLNFEFPLRKEIYIDKAINTLYLFGTDSVISVIQKNANFYKHQGAGFTPFDTNKELRLERDFIYEETGGIHTVKYDSYLKYGSILCGKIGHIIIDDLSSKRISSELDFQILEYMYNKINTETIKR